MTAIATTEPDSIRARRLAAGLTQEQWARRAGCSLAYARQVEGGYRPEQETPKLRALLALVPNSNEPRAPHPGLVDQRSADAAADPDRVAA